MTRFLTVVLCALGIALFTCGPARGDIINPSAATKAESALRASDQVADALLTAMKEQRFDDAYALFDSTMRAAVPPEMLKAGWTGQLAILGSFKSWTITHREEVQGRDVRVALLQFEQGQRQATIVVNPKTQNVAGFLLRPAPPDTPPAPPADYVIPSKFHAVEVTLGVEPWVLGGTLTLPTGPGPFPAAVLVHGSGPNDRDESIGANKVFKDLAEGLSSSGIAVLRYDKRTLRYGAKLTNNISVDDEVILDAIAAVKLLAARPEVDRARVFVVGHSLGALLAPEIASRSGIAAGVVLMAPPGRPLWDMLVSQLQYLGKPKEQIDDTQRKAALLKAGKLGDELLLGVPEGYWLDLAKRDGIATAKKLGKPILILRGDRDYQVLDVDVQAWRAGLANVPGVEISILPSLNHLFIRGDGKPGPEEYNVAGHVDAGVIKKLALFIQ